ncbi:ABC transporter ATP-binding protein [uncultured Enterovirga sp.]|uniref:ABC transporter ATP-binding protein n=1 Tax=uncultured Enterovirga sp. TaxID=2026352 RepID=UPI0035CA7DE4
MSEELRVENLRKVFSVGRPAIDDVSFTVAAGEIVVLLGPSGCGKTTTLRCVAGLEHPTSGTISIGRDIVSAPARGVLMPPRHRNIGMVFQSYAVWPHMTVRQNVAFPLKHRKTPRGEAKAKVDEALEIVGLSEYAERPVVALSGGQMQRVALARSLVYQPRLLLLDEPLSNLDAKLRLRLRDDLRRIIKRTNVTAIYVTHDQAEAVVLGDRIGVMRDGLMLQLASPRDIYNQPADLFVANFTGASNEIDGKVIECSGHEGIVETTSGARLRATFPATIAAGSPATIAFRPEAVRLGASDAINSFTANVVDCRYHGTQTIYDLSVFGGRIEVLELSTEIRFHPGSEVPITLPHTAMWAYAGNATARSQH